VTDTTSRINVERLIKPLIQRLLSVESFEDGAATVLPIMLTLVSQYIAETPLKDTSAVARAMIHLRPEGGYRSLVVLEAGADRISLPYENPSLLPSATAWQWVERCRSAIAVDVVKGWIKPLSAHPGVPGVIETSTADSFSSGETVRRLLGRHATHLLVLPLRGVSGKVHGMISVEVDARLAVGDDFIWPHCAEALQLIADIAAPALVSLPQRQIPVIKGDPLLPVVGKAMANLVAVLNVFAQQDETLLITGPSGAGKSRLAEWCHSKSLRQSKPFHTVDLLTVPEDMQMAELFGWKRGAFTGAVSDHQGSVALAEGGTLFIDEIDKLSLKAQAGLLHLLETKRYRVLGDASGAGARQANVRFIVGTNADLDTAVTEGRFREDLFYRINILPVRLPALKERGDEIPAWAQFMAQRKHKESGRKGQIDVGADAASLLARHAWPGNLRQLDNVIRRAYAMSLVEQGAIADDLSIQLRHVERALGMESGEENLSLVGCLRRAAQAFLDEAIARKEQGGVLDLNHATSFQGFVLSEALTRLNDRKDAYLLFGKQKAVESRNYHKELKRELLRVEELLQDLGNTSDSTLMQQINSFKDD
jgi:DNA-binding NtrC family response regulator